MTHFIPYSGGGPRVVVSTAAFHARVRGSVPGLGGLKEKKMFLPHPRVKLSSVGSLCDREIACSASDRQGSNFESCVWRTVSSQSSHHPQEVLLAQFSLCVHKGGLKPDSFHSYTIFGPRYSIFYDRFWNPERGGGSVPAARYLTRVCQTSVRSWTNVNFVLTFICILSVLIQIFASWSGLRGCWNQRSAFGTIHP